MRFIVFFLVIITLSLSLIPCGDGADKTYIFALENAMPHSDSGDHHGEHQDGCTPFCTCNCCASGAVFLFNSYQIASPIFFASNNTPLDQSGISEFQYSIWQPPKI
ncbi:MAG: hypothetical protein K2X86_09325 [Cytophagaceae bacterium]|nr:hypothetical protein [Cytophagaceae bacterium]